MSGKQERELPPGWAMARIEDLFWPLEDGRTLHQGWSPLCEKSPAPTDEEWGVLKTTAIQAGEFLPQHNKHLPKNLVPRPQTEVKSGDILITCAGPRVRCGVACLVRTTRPRLMMSGKMYRFRVSPNDMDARYLEAFLLTPEATSAVDKMKTGGSDSGLNLTHDRFRPLPIPVAPLNEQRRIMDVVEELFSDLDAGVSTLKRLQIKLKNYRTAMLKAAAEGRLTTDWRTHNPDVEPASSLLARILTERRQSWEDEQLQKFMDADKEPPKGWKAKYREPITLETSHLPLLPKNWCWAIVGQLSASEANSITDGPFGSNLMTEHYTDRGPRVIRLQNIKDGFFADEKAHISEAKFDRLKKHAAYEGDIVIAGLSDNPPRACIIPGFVGPAIVKADCIRFKPQSELSEKCLCFFLNALPTKMRLKQIVHGVGRPRLNLSDIKSIELPLPPLEEQKVIATELDDQFSVIDHLETDLAAKLKSAQALRQSILRDAFAGKLVPQDPNDKPATELLARIAVERAERTQTTRSTKPRQARPKRVAKTRRRTDSTESFL